MTEPRSVRDALRVRTAPDGTVALAGYDPGATPGCDDEDDAENGVDGPLAERLFDAHELLFANAEQSVLLVLQGMDASGKNGTIKHVVISMNPAGVRTTEFAAPTEEELSHDVLWRYRRALPEPGQLGVFARSHYEDVLEPTVSGEMDQDALDGRLEEINEFEQDLADDGTVVLKCFLHLSYDEQRERFLRRLRRDDKRWKFDVSDLDTRRNWDEYQSAYASTLAATSTQHAPWYVVPSDHKWYRNWAIARLLLATLDDLELDYPQPELDLEDLRSRLEPPN